MYKSLAQQRFFHTNRETLEKQGVNVAEWDKAINNQPLPERIGETRVEKAKNTLRRGMSGKSR